jgi:hypothetical protein
MATRSVVAGTPGTGTRRQEIAGPGGGVPPVSGGVGETPGAVEGLDVGLGEGDGEGERSPDGGPAVAGGPVGVTDPQAASRPMSGRPAASSRNGPRIALGCPRERLGTAQG